MGGNRGVSTAYCYSSSGDDNDLFPKLQSAYRKSHSTETALVKMVNDILLEMNRQHVFLFVLNVAFDTVDHTILLRRLETCAQVVRLLPVSSISTCYD